MFADHCSLVWCNKEQIAGHDLVEVFLLIPELYFSITCVAQHPVCTLSCLTLPVWDLWHLPVPKSTAVPSGRVSSLSLRVLSFIITQLCFSKDRGAVRFLCAPCCVLGSCDPHPALRCATDLSQTMWLLPEVALQQPWTFLRNLPGPFASLVHNSCWWSL